MRTHCFAVLALGTATTIAACSSTTPTNTVEGSGGQAAPSGGISNSAAGGNTATSNGPGGTTSATSSAISPSTGGQTGQGGTNTASSNTTSARGGSSPASGGTASTGGTKPAAGGTTATNGGTTATTGGTKPSVGGNSSSAAGRSAGGATVSGANNGGSSAGGKDSSTGGAAVVVAIGGSHSGEATFYTPNGNGNCSFGHAVDGKDIAALNKPDYGLATWCGACAEVTGPKGTITVLIQDQCPECKSGDLDLNPEAFDKIADHAAGRVKITWKFVPCDVTGPVQYHFKDGSSVGWVAVQVLNHRLPIAKFEYSIDGTTWTNVERVEYNYFLRDSGFGPNMVKVRITAATGQTLIDTLPFASSDTVIDGQANF